MIRFGPIPVFLALAVGRPGLPALAGAGKITQDEKSAEQFAREAQNPIVNLISLPFQFEFRRRAISPAAVGRLFKIDKLPINMQLAAYYNSVTPSGGP